MTVSRPDSYLMLRQRHEGSHSNRTSRLESSVNAASFPDGDTAKARTVSLPVSSEGPPSLKTKRTRSSWRRTPTSAQTRGLTCRRPSLNLWASSRRSCSRTQTALCKHKRTRNILFPLLHSGLDYPDETKQRLNSKVCETSNGAEEKVNKNKMQRFINLIKSHFTHGGATCTF